MLSILDKILSSKRLKTMESKLVYQTFEGDYKLFGKYNIKKTKDSYVLTKKGTYTLNTFWDLRNAVAWATLDKNNRLYETTRILMLDATLAAAIEHVNLYETLLSRAKDTDGKLLYSIKLTESIYKRNTITHELDKYISQSKYWQTLEFNRSMTNYLK